MATRQLLINSDEFSDFNDALEAVLDSNQRGDLQLSTWLNRDSVVTSLHKLQSKILNAREIGSLKG